MEIMIYEHQIANLPDIDNNNNNNGNNTNNSSDTEPIPHTNEK